VANFSQVRHALPRSQTCRGGSMQSRRAGRARAGRRGRVGRGRASAVILWKRRNSRSWMPEVALDDMQRNAGIEQAGRARVAEAMRATKVDRPPMVVAEIEPADELAEALLEGAVGVRAPAEAVLGQPDKQVRAGGVPRGWDAVAHPVLLGADDRDDLLVNEDRVGGVVDRGLLAAQLGGRRSPGLSAGRQPVDRDQRVESSIADAPQTTPSPAERRPSSRVMQRRRGRPDPVPSNSRRPRR